MRVVLPFFSLIVSRLWTLVLAVGVMMIVAPTAKADQESFLDLADQGWGYELRNTMLRRDLTIPVRIHGRNLAGAAICVVGEPPVATTRKVLNDFRALFQHIFERPLPLRYAGRDSRSCGAGRTVVLRLYSGFPPNRDLSDDINRLNLNYGLGLPKGRRYTAMSPAMAQTFFGRRGQATHIMVAQPRILTTTLDERYFKSILIEELYQAFSFGMDVLVFDRHQGFLSKLQEYPVNLGRLPWNSEPFKRALLSATPGRLCPFDIFMLHAVAATPVEQTTDPAFQEFIRQGFPELSRRMHQTMRESQFSGIIDPECRALRDG